ncbi:MAG: NAD(P)H-binding protein [Silvanigrellaceae bacterium]
MTGKESNTNHARIVIAGASGFIGMDLLRKLSSKFQVIALTRSPQAPSTLPDHFNPGVYWLQCNLFSLRQTETAVAHAKYAFYLVHSMSPGARLTQGKHEDLDVIIADNFSRAAASAGIHRIVYLGGIQPPGTWLSDHLRGRLEVERVLQSRSTNNVALRAGLILGPGGSSSMILIKLVKRLPVLVCPSWTRKMSSPVSLRDVSEALIEALNDESTPPGSYDLAGPENISYRKLMQRVASELNVRRFFVPFLGIPPGFSRLWVSTITGASRELVAPLIQSLVVDLLPGKTAPVFSSVKAKDPLMTALHHAELPRVPIEIAHQSVAPVARPATENSVVSIQRMPLPEGWSAPSVAQDYAFWLPRMLTPLIRLETSSDGHQVRFFVRGVAAPILELEFMTDRSDEDRALFFVRGGLLRKQNSNPMSRLEFRVIPQMRIVLAAVLDFTPSLPWYFYRLTQAQAHRFIMWRFAARLKKIKS